MNKQLRDFYLDWFNNYLTVEKIAEHHGIGVDDAEALIKMGRYMHQINVETMNSGVE